MAPIEFQIKAFDERRRDPTPADGAAEVELIRVVCTNCLTQTGQPRVIARPHRCPTAQTMDRVTQRAIRHDSERHGGQGRVIIQMRVHTGE